MKSIWCNRGPNIYPPILGLFQKRIEGDDALLQLAALRFKEAGLGPEFYAETPHELDRLFEFKPAPEAPAAVHLPRWVNLFTESGRSLVLDFAKNFKNRVFGLIIHDQSEIITRFDDYVTVLRGLESRLEKIKESPCLFIEYAAGLEPDMFIELFRAARTLRHVGSCIDIGHLGLWYAREVYSRKYPGKDICALKPHDPGLGDLIGDVQEAVASAPAEVIRVVREIGRFGKQLHYHLHDAHPLSTFSPFGVADHLSFLNKIMLPFEYMGKRDLDLMFGPSGVSRIVAESLGLPGPCQVSFSLEIHPTEGRVPLGNASGIFRHWRDKGNAERMNFWLSVICENHQLVLDAVRQNIKCKEDEP
jgi:hypothetical protein